MPAEAITIVRNLVLSIQNEWIHRKTHLIRKRGDVEVVFIAVDATPHRWAMWPMVEGKVVTSQCKEANFAEETPIDVAEATCLHKGVVCARGTAAKV